MKKNAGSVFGSPVQCHGNILAGITFEKQWWIFAQILDTQKELKIRINARKRRRGQTSTEDLNATIDMSMWAKHLPKDETFILSFPHVAVAFEATVNVQLTAVAENSKPIITVNMIVPQPILLWISLVAQRLNHTNTGHQQRMTLLPIHLVKWIGIRERQCNTWSNGHYSVSIQHRWR